MRTFCNTDCKQSCFKTTLTAGRKTKGNYDYIVTLGDFSALSLSIFLEFLCSEKLGCKSIFLEDVYNLANKLEVKKLVEFVEQMQKKVTEKKQCWYLASIELLNDNITSGVVLKSDENVEDTGTSASGALKPSDAKSRDIIIIKKHPDITQPAVKKAKIDIFVKSGQPIVVKSQAALSSSKGNTKPLSALPPTDKIFWPIGKEMCFSDTNNAGETQVNNSGCFNQSTDDITNDISSDLQKYKKKKKKVMLYIMN